MSSLTVGLLTLKLRPLLRCFLAVNHPRYPKSIDAHAEASGPEGLLEWHLNLSVFRQRVKDAFALDRIFDLERHGKALWLLIVPRRSVRSHQYPSPTVMRT